MASNLCRRTRGNDFPAAITCLGADIENVVSLGDYIDVMFDQDHRISVVDQPMQDLDEQLYV